MGVMDLLISALCIHHNAQLVTSDAHIANIAKVSKLRLQLLKRRVIRSFNQFPPLNSLCIYGVF